MIKPKISTKQYEASIAAARKKGGDEQQSHWESRLKTATKRRAKAVKKPTSR
jgi:hypothetical protein